MPKLKRTASAELVWNSSPFHSSVTLFTTAPDTEGTPLRRSKRVKVEDNSEETSQAASPQKIQRKSRQMAVATSSAVKLEEEVEMKLIPSGAAIDNVETRAKSSPRKAKLVPQALKVPHPAPLNWRDTYDTIKRMRAKIVAPVDTMGCDRAQLKESEPKNQRFATLVSLMLSSQTKDAVTDAAVSNLREAVGGTLSVDNIIAADEGAISEAIAKVGFWRRKTQYIKQAAAKLRAEFDSDVPKTVDELCSLPGVGPKMAFLALQVAWKINVGIGVDVHVHRITNRLGWHRKPTKTPEETRLNLQSWLPTELHPEINHLLVGFGQTVCLPVGPKCDQCELSDGRCPSAAKATKVKKRTAISSAKNAGPKVEIEVEITKELPAPVLDAPSPLTDLEEPS